MCVCVWYLTADDEWLQCAQNHWPRWLRWSVRLSEGRHWQDVRTDIECSEQTFVSYCCTLLGLKLLFYCIYCVSRYAMKCLDKKRIKMKGGETLALNERIMLSLVSTGVSTTVEHLIIIQSEEQLRTLLTWVLIISSGIRYWLLKVIVTVACCRRVARSLCVWRTPFKRRRSSALFWTWWMAGTCTITSHSTASSLRRKCGSMHRRSSSDWSTCTPDASSTEILR